MSVRVLRGLVNAVESAGVSRARFLRAAQLQPAALQNADGRISRSHMERLCELAIDLTDDPALGLHWAEQLTDNIFTPLAELVAHAPTLRQSFKAISQFYQLVTDGPYFELLEDDVRVHVRFHGAPSESLPMRRLRAEMLVFGMLRLARSFSVDARPEEVCFEYAAPPYHVEYGRLFGGVERFDQPFTAIGFDRRLMDIVSLHRDDDFHGALLSFASRHAGRVSGDTSYAMRARDQLVQHLPSARLDMPQVARALGLSVRSLRRRLKLEDTPFQNVEREALAVVAKQLLTERERTIQEVAYAMGFSSAGAFHRAFKRWTGLTPRSFLREHGAVTAV